MDFLGCKLTKAYPTGPSVSGTGSPAKHAFDTGNLQAKETLTLTGRNAGISSCIGGDFKSKIRNIHGTLNAVSWWFLLPVGVIIARYMRPFPSQDPAWFYLHVCCQISSSIIGVAGWATGMKMGRATHVSHRSIGIGLFALANLQMFALFLRPAKDHKYRKYWNNYHHGVGFFIFIAGIVNVLKGFEILQPANHWKIAYIAALSVLGVTAVVLEALAWKRRSNSKNDGIS